MLLLEVITWWYGSGWKSVVDRFLGYAQNILVVFSVPLLIRTLFSPWRRIITFTDNSFIQNLKAALDNAVSRFVGLGVRLIVLFTALLILLFTAVSGIIAVIVWPFLPLVALAAIFRGLMP